MKMRRSLVLSAMVAVVSLIAVASMPASQQASAAHHKAHAATTQVSTTVAVHHKAHAATTQVSTTVAVHHKAHTASKGKVAVHQVVSDSPSKAVMLGSKAVIPEAHAKVETVLQNATAMKALLKGPYGESDVIGGMMSGGY